MIHLKAISEEKYLRQFYGEDYAQYCRRTRRFVPFPARGEPAEDHGSRPGQRAA
jgi:hypothetical protein